MISFHFMSRNISDLSKLDVEDLDLPGGSEDQETDSEDDGESDSLGDDFTKDEIGLEPSRSARPQSIIPDSADDDWTVPAARLRGGFEGDLSKDPVIVKFPSSTAGAVYSRDDPTVNDKYAADLGQIDNQFAPFRSKIEWEIAKWAKLRGPSSTAFTELMQIDGVSV